MKRRRRVLAVAVLMSLCLVGTVAAATWSPAGNLALARVYSKAALLTDGRVLLTGGNTTVGNTYDTKLAEIYDPSTNTWSSTGSTANGRTDHTATRLADGRVLVVGGENANICTNDLTSELYDPVTGTWSFSGNANVARTGATATLLSNGKVLLAGGGNRCGTVFSSAELYDPGTGTWSATGGMTTGREWASAVRLSDGRVLAVGGEGPSPFPALSSAEIYDPLTGTWTATGSMGTTRCCGTPFLARLSDGRALAAGGYSGNANFIVPNGPAAEVYDPATGVWTPTGSSSVGRASGTLSLLSSGKVLVAGGTDGTTFHATAELWDPGTGTWSATASLGTARAAHTGTVLANGNVLVATGYDGFNYLTSAELYTFDDVPPTITMTTPPEGAVYTLGQVVLADYACDDGAGGSGVASCVGDVLDGTALDTASVGAKTFTVDATDNAGNPASATHNYSVVYDFSGFFPPVDNPPVFNSAKAGSAIPTKFSLDGDQGLSIFAAGYPKSQQITCDASATLDGIEETVTAGSSSLSYDASTDQYVYVWKTAKAWANTCRKLIVQLVDGTDHIAYFRFR